MRIRTLALALALGCGMTTMAGAKQKPATHKVSVKKNKGYQTNKANRFKPRKAKRVKSRRPTHR
jgi:hypothetical protein